MQKTVVFFDGPVGVGKTSLGRDVARQLDFEFLDGDDFAEPGQWLRSGRRTSHQIVTAAEAALQRHDGVLVSYPLRRTNWIFYKATFERQGVAFFSVGLNAHITSIRNRARKLSPQEITRSQEMSAQGYGRQSFHAVTARTDQGSFEHTSHLLAAQLSDILRL